MTVRDRVYEAAERLVGTKPFDRITFADVAEAAGVHWTAVRRHFGGKEELRAWFKRRQASEQFGLADTKTRVLEAAAFVFAAQGYANASLEKVAEHAGLSKGAVYWHFASKQDLFLAILERNFEQQLRMLPGQMERILLSVDPLLALEGWLESQFSCLEMGEHNSLLFLEFVVSSREPEIRNRLQKLHCSLIRQVGTLLREMQRKGYLSEEADPESMALMFDALLKGVLVEWNIDPNPAQLRTLIRTISKTLWQGLATAKR
ncbi:TetR/AcrR family transcriptional regulator [Brevibacillus brevis]|uniref:TetR/AcrR family transcriptional regulator n=1 Tax=Brevibacillus brevis TaxID=1393 RepID=A0ABY9TDJ6_BREBE|nr:TetR/AcrR family transcriptional regulator [Brevibacillus brevis]WNC17361.1 TetR/AcrR family transcriptional regulator [Brevibacillus brevis]